MAIACYSVANNLQPIIDCDNFLSQFLDASKDEPCCNPEAATFTDSMIGKKAGKRDRLAVLAAEGQTRQYLGRTLIADQIDSMGDKEIEKLYACY